MPAQLPVMFTFNPRNVRMRFMASISFFTGRTHRVDQPQNDLSVESDIAISPKTKKRRGIIPSAFDIRSLRHPRRVRASSPTREIPCECRCLQLPSPWRGGVGGGGYTNTGDRDLMSSLAARSNKKKLITPSSSPHPLTPPRPGEGDSSVAARIPSRYIKRKSGTGRTALRLWL